MHNYIPGAAEDKQAMLAQLGLEDEMQLFHNVPENLRCGQLNLPEGLPELGVRRRLEAMGERNKVYNVVLRGAGAYRHYIPSLVKQVTAKETFVTSYTPYQAEISQGILQLIFEYQSEICALTDMDVSNASVYDGASAAAEAAAMCRERKRQKVLCAANTHPDTIQTMETYAASAGAPFGQVEARAGRVDIKALAAQLDEETACFFASSPNYYGLVEDVEQIARLCHEKGVKFIYGCNPIALAVLKTPGEAGADIAVGEAQCLGLPLSFGGPYLGFMACKKELLRKLPGRIVGQTTDADGRRCFVLTLQAREQHIRREKASSSVCTNEALCTLTATAYLATMGPEGLRQAAVQSASKARYLAGRLAQAGFAPRHQGEFFHEFVTECPCDADVLQNALDEAGILGGLPVEGGLLWCCTELASREDMDRAVAICRRLAGREA